MASLVTFSQIRRLRVTILLKSKVLSGCTCCLLPIALVVLASSSAFPAESYTENPGAQGNGNFVIGPDYTIDSDLTDRGNPKGKSFEFSMRLADSKIFRGDDRTLDPKKIVPGTPMPNKGLWEEEARALVRYLQTLEKEEEKPPPDR